MSGADGQAQLAFLGLLLVVLLLIFTQAGCKQLGAVGDRNRGLVFLAVANEANLRLGAGLAGGNVGDEFIAVLDVLAIDGGDGVANLDSRRNPRGCPGQRSRW